MKFNRWQAIMSMKRNAEGFSRVAQVSFFMDPSLTNITLKLRERQHRARKVGVNGVTRGIWNQNEDGLWI